MLVKLASSTKLIVVISVSLLLDVTQIAASGTKGGLSTSSSAKLTQTSGTKSQQFQVTTAYSASSESPLSYGDRLGANGFRDTLLTKSKQVVGGSVPVSGGSVPVSGGSLPSSYGGSIYHPRPFEPVDEALPEVNLDSSEILSAERLDKALNSLNSGEEFANALGVETTSVNPLFLEEDIISVSSPKPQTIPSAAVIKAKSIQEQNPAQEIEEHELINPHHIGANPKKFQAAVKTKHTFEFRPIVMDNLEEEIQPKIIEVQAKSVPLEIHFKSASSRIKLVQTHKSGELNEEVKTSSDEEPQRLVHLVHKPIIQEVREIITPYRRIVQEIAPVMEEIHTIVTHEKEGRTHGKLTQSKQTQSKQAQKKTSTQINQSQSSQSSQSQSHSQSTQKKSQTQNHQQRVEQQKIPTEWLRPVPNQLSSSTPSPSPAKIEQVRLESKPSQQQKRPTYGGSPVFNTFPLEVTSAAPPKSTTEHESSEHANESEVEDLNDQSIELVNGNDITQIIPAKLMQEIYHEYQSQNRKLVTLSSNSRPASPAAKLQAQKAQNQAKAQTQSGSQFQAQSQSYSPQQTIRPARLQAPPTKGGFHQTQQLREAASNRNWQAIKPYVFYGPQNGGQQNRAQQNQQQFHNNRY